MLRKLNSFFTDTPWNIATCAILGVLLGVGIGLVLRAFGLHW
jgi:hypothetical protein